MPTKKTQRSTSRTPLAKSPKLAKPAPRVRPAPSAKHAHARSSTNKPAPRKPAPDTPKKPAPHKPGPTARSGAASPKPGSPARASAHAAPAAHHHGPGAARPPANSTPAASDASTYLLVLSANERRGRRFMRLKAPSVFDWFQRAIRLAREGRRMIAELGGEVHGLDEFFDAVQHRKLAIPGSAHELAALLGKHLKAERDLETEPHFIHAETDDDEIEIEYFLFDDAFLASSEALDRLPSPKRRAQPAESEDDEEVEELEEFEVEDDDDPYTALIERIADS